MAKSVFEFLPIVLPMSLPTAFAPAPSNNRTTLRRIAVLVGVTCLLVVCIVLSFALGSSSLSPAEVVHYVLHTDESHASFVVRELRTTRTIVGLVVGVSLAVAGALMQAITRNPLAEPGLLGVNAGASFAVVLGAVWGSVSTHGEQFLLAALGALISAVIVYLIGGGAKAGVSAVWLVLAGIGFSTALGGLTSALLLANPQALNSFRFWDVGALTRTDISLSLMVLPVAVGLLLAFSIARGLTDYSLGESVATALGVNTVLIRGVTLLVLTLLCATATAVAGPIGFVGLMVPFFAQILVGNHRGWIIALCAVLGPVLVLGADILGRLIARPAEIQVGILTAFVGSPVVLYLVYRMRGSRA